MGAREQIDFHLVPAHQRDMDKRLANWARSISSSWGAPSSCPMFRMTPSPPGARQATYESGSIPVDNSDAKVIGSAVQSLPPSHRAALNWHYVRPVSPKKACKSIGTSMEGLAQLVRDGRQILINRKI